MLVVNPHFQLLLSDNVLLWPGRVVFPTNDQIPRSSNEHDAQAEATRGGGTDLVTSLSRMIRLNSSTTRGPTNTIGRNTGSMQSRRVIRIAMVMERNRNNANSLKSSQRNARATDRCPVHTLFTNQRIISVVRVVGISETTCK